ncbi:hypothetical protein BUE76_10485 [Cnuella takakiae]|nr:hypothetical protein BUE76_10485 [Cnuella takakiae]
MKAKQKISPLHLVPAQEPAPVKALLSPTEKLLVDLIANIIVDSTIQQHAEKSNIIPTVQS